MKYQKVDGTVFEKLMKGEITEADFMADSSESDNNDSKAEHVENIAENESSVPVTDVEEISDENNDIED